MGKPPHYGKKMSKLTEFVESSSNNALFEALGQSKDAYHQRIVSGSAATPAPIHPREEKEIEASDHYKSRETTTMN